MLSAVIGAMIFSCTASEKSSLDDDGDATTVGQGGATTGNGGSTGSFNPTNSGGSGGGTNCYPGGDADNDGYDEPEDCNDCDANINPDAIEVATDPMDPNAMPSDEDCDGEIDELIPKCDMGLAYDNSDPLMAARALELCDDATPGGTDYGVLQAYWVRANGQPADPSQLVAFGLQADFGPNVPAQRGERMLVLSSGYARLPGQPGAAADHMASTTGYTNTQPPPPNFPQNVPNCEGGMDVYDDIGLEVVLRAPSNATGFQYLFKFHSFEFAEYVCTNFNDQYIALVDPAPMGSINGNISFDSMGNPVSVNIAFFDVCDPAANSDFAAYCFSGCPPMPSPYCPLGPSELQGSGFDNCFGSNMEDAGGTSWLQTTAPIAGGDEFKIRFAIWDTGDNIYDSTVLLDGFEWLADPGTKVGTEPPPPPE